MNLLIFLNYRYLNSFLANIWFMLSCLICIIKVLKSHFFFPSTFPSFLLLYLVEWGHVAIWPIHTTWVCAYVVLVIRLIELGSELFRRRRELITSWHLPRRLVNIISSLLLSGDNTCTVTVCFYFLNYLGVWQDSITVKLWRFSPLSLYSFYLLSSNS